MKDMGNNADLNNLDSGENLQIVPVLDFQIGYSTYDTKWAYIIKYN